MDDFFIVTHPANVELLRCQLAENEGPRGLFPTPFWGTEIRCDANMPERKIERKWNPPADDAFVEYEESDYEWLERLGAGRYESIDRGPLFYQIQKPKYRVWMDYGPIVRPGPILANCFF